MIFKQYTKKHLNTMQKIELIYHIQELYILIYQQKSEIERLKLKC